MEFEKDIFISYAHIDNESLREGQKGWITNFHRALEIRLSQIMGEAPRIWRDQKLTGNDVFSDEIIDQFPQTALFIPILSPRYMKSEWCVREVNTFYEEAEKTYGWKIGNKSRIFKVVKTPVPIEKHPTQIQGLLGYDFFMKDPLTERVRELAQIGGDEIEKAYWAKLDDLAYDIADALDKLRSMKAPLPKSPEPVTEPEKASPATPEPVAPVSPVSDDRITIYLAETTSDLREERAKLLRELKQKNYRVLPEEQMPFYGPEYKEKAEELLSESQLSIHLLGRKQGMTLEGAEASVGILQNDLAAQKSKDGSLSRLVWIPPQLTIEDDVQRQFIERIRSDNSMQYRAEILEAPLESLISMTLQYGEKLKKGEEIILEQPVIMPSYKEEAAAEEASPEAVASDSPSPASEATPAKKSPATIYLVYEQRDALAITTFKNYLVKRGHTVVLPDFGGDEKTLRMNHQKNLKECDSVLIYYGTSGELWMRAKQAELLKIAGFGRTKPLRSKGVVLAPPATESKQRFRPKGSMLINIMNGFSEVNLQSFIETLN